MRTLTAALAALALALQFQLWLGEGGLRELGRLEAALAERRAANAAQAERNRRLEAEVRDLKEGLEAVAERARFELGMIGEDETFYLIVR